MYGVVLRHPHHLTAPVLSAGHTHIQEYITCQEQLHKAYTINAHQSQGQKRGPEIWCFLQELMYQVSL